MPYMANIEVLNDIKDNIIIGLVTLLGNGATIYHEGRAAELVPHHEE